MYGYCRHQAPAPVLLASITTRVIGYSPHTFPHSKENLKVHTGVSFTPFSPLPSLRLPCIHLPFLPFFSLYSSLGSGERCNLPAGSGGGAPSEIDYGTF